MDARIIQFPKISDPRGYLSFLEHPSQIPFQIKRVYWVYDVPGGEIRGSHSYKSLHEVIIALSGSFDVVLHDGKTEKKWQLNRSYFGLYVPNMIWRTIENFSTNALCLIVASEEYNEKDYIRSFPDFESMVNERTK